VASTRSFLAFLACAAALGQTPIFRADATLQSIAVQVTDKQGNSIQGLSAADFTLLEDGKPQKISFFGAENQPVSLAVLIDSSASMNSAGKLERARELLGPLIRGNRPDDEIFLMPFTERVEAFEHLTSEQRLRPPAVKPYLSGGTALYDAIASALCHMRTAENIRQAVVVVTDGADQHSRLTLDQLIQLARASNPQIFMIGFFEKSEAAAYREREPKITLVGEREIDNPQIVFERLSKESGAESFFPSSERDLKQALDRISAVLEGQYTLAYYPRDVDRFRRIEVRVKRSGVRVSARRDVGSETGDAPVHFTASSCEVSAKDHPYPWELRATRGPSGTLTYREDFSDPRTGWPNHREVIPNLPARSVGPYRYQPGLRYVAGGYELSRTVRTNTSLPGSFALPAAGGTVAAYGPSWSDFRASVVLDGDLSHTSGSVSTAAAGLVFHMSGSAYYALLLTGTLDAEHRKYLSFKLVRKTFANDGVSDIVPWTRIVPLDSELAQKRPRKVSVEYRRGEIVALVDDQVAARVRDPMFSFGEIGLALFGDGRVVFHDLSVEELP
jgi:Ca-activated chloride channel family protein